AGDPGQCSLVDATGDEVGGAGRRPDHGHRLNHLDGKDELADQAGRAAVAGARANQAELLDVACDCRLRRAHAAPRESLGDFMLRVHRTSVDEVEDRAVALGFGRGHPATLAIKACARSISWPVMISGGTRRIEWSSTALTISPASRHPS